MLKLLKSTSILLCFIMIVGGVMACEKVKNDKNVESNKEIEKEENIDNQDKIEILDVSLSNEQKENMKPYSITINLLLSKKDENVNDYGITWYVKDDSFNKEHNDNNLVQIVKKTNDLTESTVKFDNATHIKANRKSISNLIFFQADVENLETNATYFWRCGNGVNVFSDVQTLNVKDKTASDFSFTYLTDSQNQEGYSPKNYLHKALEYSQSISDSDFIIHTGDFVQEGKNDDLWREMLDSKILRNTPLMAISGNHDYWESHSSNNGTNDTYRHFRINMKDQNNDKNSMYYIFNATYGMYYSYDYGNCHFIMLSSGEVGTALWNKQLDWLKRDLANNTKKWTILSIHEPVYSLGKYGSQTTAGHYHVSQIQQTLLPIIQGKVDLVLQGHDHILQYTYPLLNGNAVSNTPSVVDKNDGFGGVVKCNQYSLNGGVIYAMAGATGEQNRNTESNGSTQSPKELFAYYLADDENKGNYYQKGSFFSKVKVSETDVTVYYYGFLQESERVKLMTTFSLIK